MASSRRELLDPLGPGGSRRHRAAVHDVRTDRQLELPRSSPHPASLLVLDGLFLHRDELRDVPYSNPWPAQMCAVRGYVSRPCVRPDAVLAGSRFSGMRRWIVIVAAVSAIVVVAGGYLIWQKVKPPSVPAFYKASSSVANDEPGQLLRTEKIDSQVAAARLWRILYASTDINGKTIAINGLKNINEIPTDAWIDNNGGDSKTLKFIEMSGTRRARRNRRRPHRRRRTPLARPAAAPGAGALPDRAR